VHNNNAIVNGIGLTLESCITWKVKRRVFITAREEAARNPAVECPGEWMSFSMCSEDYNSKTEENAVLSQIAID